MRGVEALGVQANLQAAKVLGQPKPGLPHAEETHEGARRAPLRPPPAPCGRGAYPRTRTPSPSASRSRRTARARSRARGRSAPARAKATLSPRARSLEAKRSQLGREGVGGPPGETACHPRAGDAGEPRGGSGPESRPSPTRSSGSARGPARVARDARSALTSRRTDKGGESHERASKNRNLKCLSRKKTVSASSGTVTGTIARVFKAFLFRGRAPTRRYSPGRLRACRARPLNYHGNRRDDRSTRREIARHVARRVTRGKHDRAKKKTLASVQTTPPPPPTPGPAPSTRPHRAASLRDHEAKRAFRGTHGVTWEDRRENRKEVNREFESRPE